MSGALVLSARARIWLAALLMSMTCVAPAAAEQITDTAPRTLTVAPIRGAGIHRLDAARRGQSRTTLPASLKRLWRLSMRAELAQAPAIGDDGSIYLVTKRGELWRLAQRATDDRVKPSKRGIAWRARLGSPASAAPIIGVDGSVFVVTRGARAWLFEPDGRLRWRVSLGATTDSVNVAPLPLARGGYILATDSGVIHLGRDGLVRARAVSPEPLSGSILPDGAGALVTGTLGGVYRYRPPQPLRLLGRLGGQASGGAVLVSPSTMVAVVGSRALVAFDMRRGVARRLYTAPLGQALEGPPSMDQKSGQVIVTTTAGILIGLGPRGNVLRQLVLDPVQPRSPSVVGRRRGSFPRKQRLTALPLLLGSRGRIAFARPTGRMGVVEDERITASGGVGCMRLDALALLPVANDRAFLACRGGALILYSSRGEAQGQ